MLALILSLANVTYFLFVDMLGQEAFAVTFCKFFSPFFGLGVPNLRALFL